MLLRKWPLNLRLGSHSRKYRYGELHSILSIINSPTLRLSWTEVSSAQRERPALDKAFGLHYLTVFRWLSLTLADILKC